MALQLRNMNQGMLIEGQYLLERQLGAGGMGTVWVAQDTRLGRSVAVKFLSGDFYHDESARQRFEREARMVGRIRSPHVVQVFAAGITADGVPYVVMELLDGEDLATRLARNGPCSLAEAGVIIEQVCRALGRSHREGLVHRDIKPHNIFLMPEAGGQVFVKLLDFGIAKDVGAKVTALTVTGAVVGSVLYISPEQLRDAPSVDHLADLWALGVTTYQMLTGEVPFDGDSLPELLLRIAECRFRPATEVNPGLPAEIDAFLCRAITADRAQRYASADELANAFTRIVRAHASGLVRKGELPVPPAPAAAARPAQKPDRREHATSSPAAAVGGIRPWAWISAVVLVLVGAAGYTMWRSANTRAGASAPAEPMGEPRTITSVNGISAAPPAAETPRPADAPTPPPAAEHPRAAAAPSPPRNRPQLPAAERHSPTPTPAPTQEPPVSPRPHKTRSAHQYGF